MTKLIDKIDHLPPENVVLARVEPSGGKIPFFASFVQGGFPNPAESFVEKRLDLNDLVIQHPEATYFVRVAGDSMEGDRICAGDVLVVDSSRSPAEGKVVVVWYDGGHSVKRIRYSGQMVILESSNPAFLPIYVHKGDDFSVLGVVTHNIQTIK